jgi:predicted RNA-binding Zn ribbon-like protein
MQLPQLPFLFIGGNLALDFVNTRRSRRITGSKRIVQFDQLWNLEQAQAWWGEACAKYQLEPCEARDWTDEGYESLVALRAELRALFESIVEGRRASAGAPRLNAALSRGSFVLTLSDSGPRRDYRARDGRPDPLLAIALAAAELLAEREPSRLRACRSERCVLLFYDSTKSGTRHWCRPDCMNRARARANYRRSKAAGTDPAPI